MLVLGRRVGESIVISGEITVTVLEVRGEMVRVGIDAPRSVAVQRAELLRELEESNKASASPSDDAVASLSIALTEEEIRLLEAPYTPRYDFQGISDDRDLQRVMTQIPGFAPAGR